MLKELLDYLATLPETTGNCSIGIDELYSTSVGRPDETGYQVSCLVKGCTHTGRGLSPDEAIQSLMKKLKHKYEPT